MTKPKPVPSQLVLDLKEIRNAIYLVQGGSNPYERKQLLENACKVAHDVTEKWKKKMTDSGQKTIAPDYSWKDRAEFDAEETWVTSSSHAIPPKVIPYDELTDEHRKNIIAMLEREEVFHLFPNLKP